MKSFKVTGTPGDPVRLDTLKSGDFFAYRWDLKGWRQRFGDIQGVEGCVTLSQHGTAQWGRHSTHVHPLTRHELEDDTVEFRHVNPEPKDDIRPIGELPVGTRLHLIAETTDCVQWSEESAGVELRIAEPRDSRISLVDVDGVEWTRIRNRDMPVRVIAYPSDKLQAEKCPACNGTGVKPAPEPTYLERLPEAVRWSLQSFVNYEEDQESAARTIFEHMVPKGGA